jgi:hypothetical protein
VVYLLSGYVVVTSRYQPRPKDFRPDETSLKNSEMQRSTGVENPRFGACAMTMLLVARFFKYLLFLVMKQRTSVVGQ